MQKQRFLAVTTLLLAASALPARAGSVKVYLSSPFTQTAQTDGAPGSPNYNNGYTSAVSETFEGTAAGTYTTFTSTALSYNTDTSPATAISSPQAKFSVASGNFSVLANGQYGGGGQGQYLGVSATGQTTLQLSTPVGYLGLEWCAVDAGNSLTLYDQNNQQIGVFNAATFSNVLGGSTSITAINNTSYATANYKGQPTGTATTSGRQNTGEYYAYLNFIADPGTKISKIVLSETGATFESDNYAILTTAPAAPLGSFVFLTTVPEPSTWAMFAVAGLALLVGFRRRIAGASPSVNRSR